MSREQIVLEKLEVHLRGKSEHLNKFTSYEKLALSQILKQKRSNNKTSRNKNIEVKVYQMWLREGTKV